MAVPIAGRPLVEIEKRLLRSPGSKQTLRYLGRVGRIAEVEAFVGIDERVDIVLAVGDVPQCQQEAAQRVVEVTGPDGSPLLRDEMRLAAVLEQLAQHVATFTPKRIV